MDTKHLAEMALEQGGGILRLVPTWVPRTIYAPGRRLKLHPEDYYAMGNERGGIDERWLSSTTCADNGPQTPASEGLSAFVFQDGSRTRQVLLRDAVADLKGALIGDRIWEAYQRWPIYSKLFDNQAALPHHIHFMDKDAMLTGKRGKPEAYYFPPQINNHGGDFPYTFFGLQPGTTPEQLRTCLKGFTKGDNRITALSIAYRLEVGTGWDLPAGILHAPGSFCTYEIQRDSDVYALFQSVIGGDVIPEKYLWMNCPQDRLYDIDFLIGLLDWELNVDPEFAKNRMMHPLPVRPQAEMEAEGYLDKWICYKAPDFSAKELTVLPGRTVTLRDSAAYGIILMQGHGSLDGWAIDTPALIRYGQLTSDEFFVSESAAREGVTITNASETDPLVMIKHFGPHNPDLRRAEIA